MNAPIAFIVYKRTDTTRRVLEKIQEARPDRLYIIADGPKNKDEHEKCNSVRKIVEEGVNWKCQVSKVYSQINLGLAKRVQTGLDYVFKQEEKAIILEDDTLPDPTFFTFCEELLQKYDQDERVAHISGCNLHPEVFMGNSSYCFSSIINIWGWATWKRAWDSFDLNMSNWADMEKESFLKEWCISRSHQKSTLKLFDLHYCNKAPWSWDYQWNFTCWSNRGLSIIPKENLVSNLGIGPNGSNTITNLKIPLYPEKIGSLEHLIHPYEIKRARHFEKKYFAKMKPGVERKLRTFIKQLFIKFK